MGYIARFALQIGVQSGFFEVTKSTQEVFLLQGCIYIIKIIDSSNAM